MTDNIYLCGFMGCGKSTVGRALSEQLHCPFIDLDSLIEAKVGMRITDIFQQDILWMMVCYNAADIKEQCAFCLIAKSQTLPCLGKCLTRESSAQYVKVIRNLCLGFR